MRSVRTGFELRMKLHAHKERKPGQLNRFNQFPIRRKAADGKPGGRKHFAILVVELITVTMALGYCPSAIAFFQRCSLNNGTWICTEAQ